jgi:hypothetical protein
MTRLTIRFGVNLLNSGHPESVENSGGGKPSLPLLVVTD